MLFRPRIFVHSSSIDMRSRLVGHSDPAKAVREDLAKGLSGALNRMSHNVSLEQVVCVVPFSCPWASWACLPGPYNCSHEFLSTVIRKECASSLTF